MELISIDTKDHTYMTNRLALMEPGEREKQKKTILKMYAQAAKIKRQDAVAYLNQPKRKDLEQEREEWRITRQEALCRVHALRIELDSYREQLEAVPFDIPSGDASRIAWMVALASTSLSSSKA